MSLDVYNLNLLFTFAELFNCFKKMKNHPVNIIPALPPSCIKCGSFSCIKVWAKCQKCQRYVMLMTSVSSFCAIFLPTYSWTCVCVCVTHIQGDNPQCNTSSIHQKSPSDTIKKKKTGRENVIGSHRIGSKEFLICFLSSTALHFVSRTKLSIKPGENLFYVANRTGERVFILSIEEREIKVGQAEKR